MPSLFAILSQRCQRWLGHVCRMEDSRIPKVFLYGELASGSRLTGRPTLRFKDVCKKDLKTCGIQPPELDSQTGSLKPHRMTDKDKGEYEIS
ncbi:hypothetical protein ElyMa_003766800 [Elysia marginata]|uniref:Uncharacterized protein n=1 Tax=Elysia marginata TaxID=1093978 RepID=A0AAV4F946_9GAST|nr:hypothetical protein ElyMa_003766800 [Elysia marginata]